MTRDLNGIEFAGRHPDALRAHHFRVYKNAHGLLGVLWVNGIDTHRPRFAWFERKSIGGKIRRVFAVDRHVVAEQGVPQAVAVRGVNLGAVHAFARVVADNGDRYAITVNFVDVVSDRPRTEVAVA